MVQAAVHSRRRRFSGGGRGFRTTAAAGAVAVLGAFFALGLEAARRPQAPEPPPALEDGDLVPCQGELAGGGEPRRAGAHDGLRKSFFVLKEREREKRVRLRRGGQAPSNRRLAEQKREKQGPPLTTRTDLPNLGGEGGGEAISGFFSAVAIATSPEELATSRMPKREERFLRE